MESPVKASSNTDDAIYEMMEQPTFNREQRQDPLPPKRKHVEDKWPLRIVVCLFAVILLLLVILVGMCGFIISQSLPTECTSTTASIHSADAATAINVSRLADSISQVLLEVHDIKAAFNNSLAVLVQEIHNKIDNMEEEILYKTARISEKNNNTANKNFEQLKNLIAITDRKVDTTSTSNAAAINDTASKSLEQLKNLIIKVNTIQDTSSSNAEAINDVLLMTQRLLPLHT